MFKVNKKHTLLYTLYVTPCFSVSKVNFEKINTGWEMFI